LLLKIKEYLTTGINVNTSFNLKIKDIRIFRVSFYGTKYEIWGNVRVVGDEGGGERGEG
jgi:hypothetical protein